MSFSTSICLVVGEGLLAFVCVFGEGVLAFVFVLGEGVLDFPFALGEGLLAFLPRINISIVLSLNHYILVCTVFYSSYNNAFVYPNFFAVMSQQRYIKHMVTMEMKTEIQQMKQFQSVLYVSHYIWLELIKKVLNTR